jgi:hypothetical protein
MRFLTTGKTLAGLGHLCSRGAVTVSFSRTPESSEARAPESRANAVSFVDGNPVGKAHPCASDDSGVRLNDLRLTSELRRYDQRLLAFAKAACFGLQGKAARLAEPDLETQRFPQIARSGSASRTYFPSLEKFSKVIVLWVDCPNQMSTIHICGKRSQS